MSGSLPLTNFSAINFKSNQKTLVSVAEDGTQFTRQVDGQRFSFSLPYPLIKQSEFKPMMAFIMSQRSRKETFTVTLPANFNSSGTASGTPHGTASAGATSITLGGGASGSFKAGDIIKFANHTKVYMIVSDHADISTGTITIEPPLKSAISSQNITYDSVPITVRLVSDLQEFKTNSITNTGELLFTYEIDVSEAF